MSEMRAPELEQKLRALCEVGFEVGPPFYANTRTPAHAPTGEPYVEITGQSRIGPWGTPEGAYDGALAAFRAYAGRKVGTIYWRVTPEIADREYGWSFYMRVLISNKPVI